MLDPVGREAHGEAAGVKALGVQFLIDLVECDGKVINSDGNLVLLAQKIAKALKTPTHEVVVHKFEPQGLSLVQIVSASHIALHTWPLESEGRAVAIDIFSCDPNLLVDAPFVTKVVLPVTKGRISKITRVPRLVSGA
jgi:S-adenosylmethionine/arginine decarboxylase-like enzyme